MKRSKTKLNLKLDKKTLRNLSGKEMSAVNGGNYVPRPTQVCIGG